LATDKEQRGSGTGWLNWSIAVVLQGLQGAGKSFFGEAVMSLFHERHAFQTASLEDLTGQFTSHTALAIVVLLDEAF
jgi:pantothenate kinase-related protein Tda10